MRRSLSLTRLLRDQSGMTLIEVIASLFILLMILIPLTSVYVSGVQVYNQTREQSALRNAADFVIGDVMRTVQDATYFELEALDERQESAEQQLLVQILKSKKAGELLQSSSGSRQSQVSSLEGSATDDIADSIILYNSKTVFAPLGDASQPSAENSVSQSLLTRQIYRFPPVDPTDELVKAFRTEPGYLVRGLFTVSADSKTLTLYLLVAPQGEKIVDRDGQQMRFQNLEEVLAELVRMEAYPDQISGYIRLVKTDFAVSNLRGGYK
ncbi:prepilin-type N-terminal cleavage/methylation domain-containing protein [Brevibacillus ruminantium]|uniref:Prepilin-type N-terminal cleavage/methylation domain-containing protein n=1 Tax=Brevibacillus ruminantium TaxID=2950604 RepID=A0ABY4WFT4_9BACL|nr:prepilin-type N-terminal cleavage/methylation domain-containing protein [Brevibacillus ruminantium]USG64675.1 prepilin-type N-terminal cleavage/methylation domain-containing protein [Brevibacillus ruminantium]